MPILRNLTIACTSLLLMAASAPAHATAETARDIMVSAAYQTSDKATALAMIDKALQRADAVLAARPGDREAMLQRGVAIGYRGKLARNIGDAKAARAIFEELVKANPRDAEAQMLLAGWHLDAIAQLGGLLARTALGARQSAGDAALDRSVALGGNRALYPGMAAILRIRENPKNVPLALKLATAAIAAPAPTPLDRHVKRAVETLLPSLRANDGKAAAMMARRLVPFGRITN
nr:hypothetical protein [Sphingomonas laterariae]